LTPSKVYFVSARAPIWEYEYSLPAKLEELLKVTGLSKYINPGEYVPIKVHFGSEGAFRVIRPIFIRKVVEGVKAVGGEPFVTDTTRYPGLQYLEIAAANGFTHLTCGAPIVIADGVFGRDNIPVKVKGGELIKEIGVASTIHDAPAMIVMSHCKGHIGPGYGGALKNVAMGGVGTRTRNNDTNRGNIHTLEDRPPDWIQENCSWCLRCEEICPKKAITIKPKVEWRVNLSLCDRCGRCVRVCPSDALSMPITEPLFAQGMVEAAKAVLQTFSPGKVLYLNFALEIQPECDCMPMADTPLVQDQGILLSDDIVAIEQATLDLINQAQPLPQSRAFDKKITDPGNLFYRVLGRNPDLVMEWAVKLGLGSREYELITIRRKRKVARKK